MNKRSEKKAGKWDFYLLNGIDQLLLLHLKSYHLEYDKAGAPYIRFTYETSKNDFQDEWIDDGRVIDERYLEDIIRMGDKQFVFLDKDGREIEYNICDDEAMAELVENLSDNETLSITFDYSNELSMKNIGAHLLFHLELENETVYKSYAYMYLIDPENGRRYPIYRDGKTKKFYFQMENNKVKTYEFNQTQEMVQDIDDLWYTHSCFDRVYAISMNAVFDFAELFCDLECEMATLEITDVSGTRTEKVIDTVEELLQDIRQTKNAKMVSIGNINPMWFSYIKSFNYLNSTHFWTAKETFEKLLRDRASSAEEEEENKRKIEKRYQLVLQDFITKNDHKDWTSHYYEWIIRNPIRPTLEVDRDAFIRDYKKISVIADNPELEV